MNRRGVRVAVADDERAVREALADLVRSQPDLDLAGTAESHPDLLRLVTTAFPDVVLMDIRMPGGRGADTVQRIRTAAPYVAVVALSASNACDDIVDVVASGASGYLLKGTSEEEILEAVRRAVRGQLSIPVPLASQCVRRVLRHLEQSRWAEAGLRRSETTLHDLLDHAPGAVVLVGPGGRIRLGNAAADRIFGRPVNAFVGEPASMLLAERCRRVLRSWLRQAAEAEPGDTTREVTALRSDGSEFPALVQLSSLRFGPEQVVGLFIRDLSEGEGADHRYRRLVEASPHPLLVVDAGHRIELVNSLTEELLGYSREALLAQPLDLVLPGVSDLHLSPEGSTVMVRSAGGREFPAEVRPTSLDGDEGSLVLAVRELSRQRRHDAALEQALEFLRDVDNDHQLLLTHLVRAQEDERKRISEGIHDDSLQAITAASLRAQQLRRRLRDPEDLEVLGKLEETIRLSISRLRHLLFDLRPPTAEAGGLTEALSAYLDQLRSNTTVEVSLESDLGSQLPEEAEVIAYRIAQEALTNIWRHAGATSVHVRLTEVNRGCLVVIEDDGRGYDPVEAEGKPGHLGLSLMRERAQIAGGWCRIESTPGAGTTVQFWVPRSAQAEPVQRTPSDVSGGA